MDTGRSEAFHAQQDWERIPLDEKWFDVSCSDEYFFACSTSGEQSFPVLLILALTAFLVAIVGFFCVRYVVRLLQKIVREKGENRKPFWLSVYAGLTISIFAIVLWLVFGFAAKPDFLDNFALQEKRFGAFEALMSALALVGLIFALAVQQHELKMQQAELRLTNTQTKKQTEIFRTENLERRIVQALDHFKEFQRTVDFTASEREVQDCKTLEIPRKIVSGQNIGKELAGSLARICVSRVLLAGAPGSDEDLEKLRKRMLTNEIAFYGGVIHPLISQVRLILIVIDRLKSELLGFAMNSSEFNTNHANRHTKHAEENKKIEVVNQTVEYYATLLREELKPDQRALIALCALYGTPYDDLGRLVKSTSFLNDFNWLWRDIFFNGYNESYLVNSKPLSSKSQQEIRKLGLKVYSEEPERHGTIPLRYYESRWF